MSTDHAPLTRDELYEAFIRSYPIADPAGLIFAEGTSSPAGTIRTGPMAEWRR